MVAGIGLLVAIGGAVALSRLGELPEEEIDEVAQASVSEEPTTG